MKADSKSGSPASLYIRKHKPLIRYAALSVIAWTLVMVLSLWWNVYTQSVRIMEIALNDARTSFNKDIAFRKWATLHGGVYVPVTEQTTPNPNLAHIPERDLTTPSGRQLTLINPAYMMRQMMQVYSDEFGVRSRITSLKPLNEMNAPDEWETAALKSFEKGVSEVAEVSDINGQQFLRMIRPLYTMEGCLKCHAHQGYSVGDVRGAVGVYVPLAPLREIQEDFRLKLFASHGGIWLIGLLGLGVAFARIGEHINARDRNEAFLESSLKEKEVLLQEVHHRVKNNMAIISSLLAIQAGNVSDDNVKRMFAECRGRIRSMALVHEKLYGSQDFARINFDSYVRQLVADVLELYGSHGIAARVEVQSDKNLSLGLDVLIPLGLIVNELVTNSMKHAFDGIKDPLVSIELKEEFGGGLRFTYKDNGNGIPAGVDMSKPGGVGLLIVNVLAKQLDGQAIYETGEPGMYVVIEIPGGKRAGVK